MPYSGWCPAAHAVLNLSFFLCNLLRQLSSSVMNHGDMHKYLVEVECDMWHAVFHVLPTCFKHQGLISTGVVAAGDWKHPYMYGCFKSPPAAVLCCHCFSLNDLRERCRRHSHA